MKTIGMCVRKILSMGALLVIASGIWAAEFREKVERVFSPSVIEAVHESGASGLIAFKVPERMPDYFKSGDKANKVFAIESVRLFRDVPSLKLLTLKIPNDSTVQVLNISRADIEQYYGVDLAAISGDPNSWRTDFIQRYDTKESRAEFVKHFVK